MSTDDGTRNLQVPVDIVARWERPRRVSVVVDNPSWVIPYAKRLVDEIRAGGDEAMFVTEYSRIRSGTVAFYLGCTGITPPEILKRNAWNLVVHASDLPKGRGFSPLTWKILEGQNRIPICLLEATEQVDSGPVIYRDWMDFAGHELIDELRAKVGEMSLSLCRRFLESPEPPVGSPQIGDASTYPRRRPADSRIDPELSIASQFNLLRVVDNERYPAWFDYLGHRYKIMIEKWTKNS